MSTLKSVTLLTGSVAALALTACSHSAQADRYGNVYDYEGGAACVENCGAPATSRYGDTGYVQQAPVYQGRTENVIYADCSVINGMACPAPVSQPAQVYTQPAPVYTQPAPVYTQPAPVYTQQTQTYTTQSAPAECPSGTTPNGDGTCMQNSYESTTSYTTPTTSYESYDSTPSYTTPSYSTGAVESAPCPAGTTAAGDGTCMESSYGSTSYDTTSSSSTYDYGTTSTTDYGTTDYGSSYGTTSSTPVSCPSGTTPNGDGSCAMNEGYSVDSYQGGSVEVYGGGYTQSGGYTATDYRPVRK